MRLVRSTALGAILMVLITAGCASQNDRGLTQRTISVEEFAKPAQTTVQAQPHEEPQDASPSSPDETTATIPAPARPAPERPSLRRGEQLTQPGDVVVIDGVVGQVSGRPIFAGMLLDPIADQLRQEAARLSAQEFPVRAQQLIFDRLREVVLSELFIAEAEASLTPEQQQGLLAFIRMMQERTIAAGQGSRSITEERLMEEMGLTLEQYTERERHMILIQHQIARKVSPRVIVSWRDVQREYQKRQDQFSPPSAITLKFMRFSTRTDADKIESVRQQFAAGASFDEVAATAPDAVTTLDPLPMGAGGIADLPIAEAFKSQLVGLGAGDTTPAIEADGRIVWVHVAAIEQPQAKSLYDVQRQLTRDLEARREAEERDRYIRSLFQRGIHDELDEMAKRVLTIALLRYGK